MCQKNTLPRPRIERGVIDIGRVLLPDDTHHMVLEEIINVAPLPGAIEALSKMVQRYGAENIHIVSRVLNHRKILLRAWLKTQYIFDRTGLINDDDDQAWQSGCRKHVIWCNTFFAKGPIVRDLEATFVVDDQPEVHASIGECHIDIDLEKDERRLRQYGFRYLEKDREVWDDLPTRVILIETWKEFIELEGL